MLLCSACLVACVSFPYIFFCLILFQISDDFRRNAVVLADCEFRCKNMFKLEFSYAAPNTFFFFFFLFFLFLK